MRSRFDGRILLWAALALACASPASAGAQSEKRVERARAAIGNGSLEKAKLQLKLALQENPIQPEAHFLLACLLAREGELDQSIVGFRRAIALDPGNPAALFNLGTALLRRGEAVPAASLIESAISIRPDHAPSYNNLAKAYFLAGLPELAVAAYDQALRLEPSNAVALAGRAALSPAGGERELAAATATPALPTPAPVSAGVPTPAPVVSTPAPSTPAPSGSPAPAASPSPAPPAAGEADPEALKALLHDLPNVAVEKRGDRLTLSGWTSGPKERELLTRIIAGRPNLLDLTGEDLGDPQRMIEVDTTIFVVSSEEAKNVGFNFLRFIELTFGYFSSGQSGSGNALLGAGALAAASHLAEEGWLLSAAVDYDVNIANALDERVALLARPHLTALSGTPASFLAGGEFVFRVSGINTGDIRVYPFGTTLTVTPTLLRTPGADGKPRVRLAVEAGRTSILSLVDISPASETGSGVFDKIKVTSESVIDMGQTLILSGISQRESRVQNSGVPILRSIPIVRLLFSTKTEVDSNLAVIILLTPRDPAYLDEKNQKAVEEFVVKRRAFVQAARGTDEQRREFQERYPDWRELVPNRLASHFFMMNNSELYRSVSGTTLATEELDFELLGEKPKKKKARKD